MDSTSNQVVQGTYTAEQIATILGISIRKAYDLCETTNDFKVIRLGRCLRVHKQSFDKWFNDLTGISIEAGCTNERSS